MNARLRDAWQSRAPLERTIIAVLAVLLAIMLYGWLVWSAGGARVQLRTSVLLLEQQAALLDKQALEYARLRALPPATASPGDLRPLVQARIAEAGLSPALISIDAVDANQVRVVFGALPFADWLAWVANLQAQQVRLDHCRIEALAEPRMVGVSATFMRAGS